jgi:hypothetical protein
MGDTYLINGHMWVYVNSTTTGSVNGFKDCGNIQGPAGRSISSITGPVTNGLIDTYTIHYSDNTTSTFTVTNGATGSNGTNGTNGNDGRGITGVVKSNTNGLIDTYTISYSDSTTSNFTVTNGNSITGATIDANGHLQISRAQG